MKFIQEDFGNSIGILKFPDHYVAVAVTVDDAGVVAGSDGKKIVKAGTIVGGTGGANAALANQAIQVTAHNSAGATTEAGAAVDAEGVLMSDVDVTYGPASGAMIIHGYLDLTKVTTANGAAPHANAVTALKGITFIK